ncbi:MAG: ATP-binding cassette domain-containing protein, partial [Deltaproteobacteria bacterium]|nr:ATP-binding cassette domain-containing protein [Deltaproteobacteria bacterium]
MRRPFLALLALLILIPLLTRSHYYVSILVVIGLHSMVALGLILLSGYAGQISLGHASFYGLGAYVSAILTTAGGLSPWLGMLLAALFTGSVALLIGVPILRLRGHFLAMATLGWGLVVHILMNELRELTGGPSGITGLPYLSLAGVPLDSDLRYYVLAWAVCLGLLLLAHNVVRSRVGLALRALREYETAAATLGVDVSWHKVQVFALSAVYASLAGSLYAHYLVFVNPSPFGFLFSIELVVMVMVGGVTHLPGALVGTALVTLLREGLRAVLPRLMGQAAGEYEIIAYGLALVVLIVAMPEGLWPKLAPLFGTTSRRGAGRLTAVGFPGAFPASPGALAGSPGLPASKPLEGPLLPAEGQLPIQPARGGPLEIRGVTRAFGGLVAVNDLSLGLPPGELLALIGPNGAGKTTLLNMICGLLPPSRGELSLGGRPIHRLAPHIIARLGIARTFQNLRIFGAMTVAENVMVGLHRWTRSGVIACAIRTPQVRAEDRAMQEEALALLDQVGLAGQAHLAAASLPFGQQRTLELARALATRPRLLLLDEPAAGLTAGERAALGELIRKIHQNGVAVLLVEHNMDLVMEVAERIAVLNYGSMLREGSPAEVRGDPRVIEAYLGHGPTAEPAATPVPRPARAEVSPGSPAPALGPVLAPLLLEVQALRAAYGRIEALKGLSLCARAGEIVGVVGPNGAGKTTLVHTIIGILHPTAGEVRFRGAPITGLPAERAVRLGLALVPERRQLFSTLTVLDGLRLGAYHRLGQEREMVEGDLEEVFRIFPVLRERRRQLAGTLSGGEQQMLALGRGLMARPALLLLDEPCLGLAPRAVRGILGAVEMLRQ